MRVAELMKREVQVCHLADSLDKVARSLWEHDVGAVPAVADSGMPLGMVTDRDICMAALFSGRALGDMTVEEILRSEGPRPAVTCSQFSSVADALAAMKRAKVRRLPVVNEAGLLVGVVSIADLAQATGKVREVRPTEVLEVLKAVTAARGLQDGAGESLPEILRY